jgi:hypothetical protein
MAWPAARGARRGRTVVRHLRRTGARRGDVRVAAPGTTGRATGRRAPSRAPVTAPAPPARRSP